jgi:hypothetical protein
MRLVAKHSQVGYQTPGERPGCRNCKHFEVTRHDSPVIAPRTACTKHDLEVTSGGICPDHKLQRRKDESQLAFLARQRDLLESQVADLRRGELVDVVQEPKEQTRRAREYLAGFDGRTHAISRGSVVPQVRERRS